MSRRDVAFIPSSPLPSPSSHRSPFRNARMSLQTSRERNRATAARAQAAREAELAEHRVVRERLDAEFRALQAANRGNARVHMFNVDEYELDERGLLWERELRGRKAEDVAEAARARDGVAEFGGDAVVAYEDLQSQEEIEGFEERAREVDPMGNGVWADPMPESDFDAARIADGEDEDFIHFRGDLTDEGEGDEEGEREMVANALPAVRYESEEEEVAALNNMFDEAEWKNELESECETAETSSRDSVVPLPDPEEYKKWQKAAEDRGGNATAGDSHALGPAKLATPEEVAFNQRTMHQAYGDDPSLDAAGAPPQMDRFVEAHEGEWEGVFSVHRVDGNMAAEEEEGEEEGGGGGDDDGVNDGGAGAAGDGHGRGGEDREEEDEEEDESLGDGIGDDAVLRPAHALWAGSVRSVVGYGDGEAFVNWSTSLSLPEESAQPFSEETHVPFSLKENMSANALAPGRAVFGDGSYMLQSSRDADAAPRLSLSDKFVTSLLGKADGGESDGDSVPLEGVAEACVVSHDGAMRHRALVYAQGGVVSHVVSICETRTIEAEGPVAPSHSSLESSLLGRWRGRGVSLHPYFPPMPVSEMTSVQDFESSSSAPAPQDLTYVKEEVSSSRAALDGATRSRSAAQNAGQGSAERQKLSKRVIQALKRDAVRLAGCRLVSNETLQEVMTERTAWQVVRGGLYSPRLGPRVPDYFALSLPGGAVFVSSIGNWNPGVRSRLELIVAGEVAGSDSTGGRDKKRSRLIGARSAEGLITGVALLRESSAIG